MGCDAFDAIDPLGGQLSSALSGGGNGAQASVPSGVQPTQSAFGGYSPNYSICNGSGTGGVSSGNGALSAGSQVSPNQNNASGPTNSIFNQLCGSTNTVIPQTRDYNDPLGPNASGAMAPSGGPEMRAGIYSALQQLYPGIAADTQGAVDALKSGATNPGYTGAAQLANDEINGKYLNGSPQLDTAVASMRNNAQAEAANTAANIKSQYARNGLSFSTPQTQALQSNQAAATASSNNSENQMRLANYQAERTNQNNAVQTLDDATGTPINYLSQVNAAKTQPLSSIAQMVSGLSGGYSTSYQPQDITQNDGYLRSLTKDVGSL